VLHRRRHGLSFEGYLLSEKIDHALELHRFVAGLDELPSLQRQHLLRRSIDQVARLVRDLHLRNLSHRDLKAANILVRREWLVVSNKDDRVASSEGRGLRSEDRGLRIDAQRLSECPQSSILDPRSSSTHHSPHTTHQLSVWLIDLVGVKLHRWLSRRRRVRNL